MANIDTIVNAGGALRPTERILIAGEMLRGQEIAGMCGQNRSSVRWSRVRAK